MDNNLNRSGDEENVPLPDERFEIDMRDEIPVNNLPLINANVCDPIDDEEDIIADSHDENSLDLSQESLKYVESVGEKFEECKRLTQEGKLEELNVAYGEFKQLTEELRDDTFEKENYIVHLRKVKADIALMEYRKHDEAYGRKIVTSVIGTPQANSSLATKTSSLKVEMLHEYDFVIDVDEVDYSADKILWRSVAATHAMDVDNRLSDLKRCWKELKKLISNDTNLNSSESLAVETKKMDAVMKIFISQKASADFVEKQISGEIKKKKPNDKSAQFIHSNRNYLEEVINDFDDDNEAAY